jgi:phospholipid transport system substrate-binding protein
LRAALIVLAAGQAPVWAAASPVDVVSKLSQGLEGVLRQARELDFRARYERLEPILTEAFDFEFMAHQAIGRQWQDLTPADQGRWVNAFEDLTVATYAARFDNYSGQKFETTGAQETAAHDTVIVRTRVIDPTAENVDLTYRLRRNGETWKVIDVFLKGSVSEIAMRRSEYASVLKREGFEGLLAAVEDKIASLAAPTPAK